MNKYIVTLDASYTYRELEIKASDILHLLSIVINDYSIGRITKIELIDI